MFNRRITDRLAGYWQRLVTDVPVPPYSRFSKEAIGDLLPACLGITIEEHGENISYRCDFLGADVEKAFGQDITGMVVNQNSRGFVGDRVLSRIKHVISSKHMETEEGFFINKKGESVRYRACFMPFTEGQKDVITKIIIGLTWHEKA